MDTGEIKKLIEAFYEGETNPEEEQKLHDYFNSDDIADELQDEKKLFLEMHKGDPIETPPLLEQKLNSLIDKLALEESKKSESNKRRLWIRVGSIAAGLALLISAGIYFNKKQEIANPDNPQLAQVTEEDKQKIKEAQDALVLLSSKFNKGVDQLALVSNGFDKTAGILNKTVNTKNEKGS